MKQSPKNLVEAIDNIKNIVDLPAGFNWKTNRQERLKEKYNI